MILNPKENQQVQIWYNKKIAEYMPYHGKTGIVKVAGKGKPRNHLVLIDENLVFVPCGNIRKLEEV